MHVMSTNDERYYLNGVNIYRNNDGYIVYRATNGYTAVVITSTSKQISDYKNGDQLNIILPAQFVKDISKPSFLKNKGVETNFVEATYTPENDDITIEMPEGNMSSKLMFGTFPNIEGLFPKHKKGIKELPDFGWSFEQMDKIRKSISAFGDKCSTVAITGQSQPIYFHAKNLNGTWECLLTPTRT